MNFSDINWLLLAVLAVLIYFTVSGYKRGFVKLLISLLSMVLTFYLVWVVTPYISNYLINETQLYSTVKEKLDTSFEEANSKRDNTIYENQIETINSYEVPGTVKNILESNNTEDVYNSLAVAFFEDYVSCFLAKIIIRIIAFVVSYIMVMLFLKMTFLSMEIISRIPVISGFNKVAGLFFGFFEGMFIVWMGYLIGAIFFTEKFNSLVGSSRFLTYLYEKNMILQLLLK